MSRQSSLGVKLVENFNLLLEYAPSEECLQYIHERMLSLPDRRTFQCVMMYILDVMDGEWRSKSNGFFVTKQDERLFYNILCDHLKALRKEFPEVCFPLLTPSSLVCFHGEKARENLWKITNALMLMIMKKENYIIEKNEEELLTEYEAICEENENLRKKIEERNEEKEKTISLEKEILFLITSSGNWGEDRESKLLDINNRNILSEINKMNACHIEDVKLLKEKLQPYLDHIEHRYFKNMCQCPSEYFLPEKVVSEICELFWEDTKMYIMEHIKNLKCASAIRELKMKNIQNTCPNGEWDDSIASELIEKLENLVHGISQSSIDTNIILRDSPLAVNRCSPELEKSPVTFTPFIARHRMKMRIVPVKMDVESVTNLIVPVKVGVSPNNSITGQVMACASTRRPVRDETIMSVVQRMRSKATPCKFSKQKCNTAHNDSKTSHFSSSMISSVASGGAMSSSKGHYNMGKFTPASEQQKPMVSQSTGQMKRTGFVKPSRCMVRRQLNTGSSLGPSQTLMHSVQRDKSCNINFHRDPDKILDMMVKKIVAEENSFSSNDSDLVDSSLSGVECITSLSASNKLQSSQNSGNNAVVAQQRNLNVSDLLSGIINEDNEIADTLNSLIDENFTMEHSDLSNETSDVFLDHEEVSTILQSKPLPQPQNGAASKVGRDSLGLLIERFKAIKKAHQQNQ